MSTQTQQPIRVPKGLANVIVDKTTISGVDPSGQHTIYRGYLIHDLGRNATFEEAAYLFLYGKLPCEEELKEFSKKLASEREIPSKLYDVLKMVPQAHPMYYGAFGVLYLGMYDPNPEDMSEDALYERAIKIIAKLPTIFINAWHLAHNGTVVHPDPSLPHAKDLLRMIWMGKRMPTDVEARAFESSLVLYMDHGFNASTFTNRVIASTLSDMYSAIAGAIGALKGPLHGGANEKAIEMILEIGEPEKARKYVEEKLARKEKIMGFGHRVYKVHDPRTDVAREHIQKLAETKPEAKKLLAIIDELEKAMWELKRIPSNIDLYTGVLYYLLDIPVPMYTPVFAMARVVGWTSHYIEQVKDNRIIRPLEEYVGPTGLKYQPIEERCKK